MRFTGLITSDGELTGKNAKKKRKRQMTTYVSSVSTAAQQKLESDLLPECLASTSKKSSSSNNSTSSKLRDPKANGISILPSTEPKEVMIPHKSISPELGDPLFSPPTKKARKRRRLSPLEPPDLRQQTSDMLEVEESEYDEDGNRRDKPSTIKKRKKTKKRSPSYQNTSMGDVQRLLDAEVQSVAPSDTSANPTFCRTT
jgi:hypothetical protein